MRSFTRIISCWVIVSAQLRKFVTGESIQPFQRWLFEQKVDRALSHIREIMEQERSVQLPEHQPFHHYSDKFSLVEQQTQILWRVLKTLFHRVGVEWGSSSTISNPDGSDATATVAGTVDNAATIPLDRGFHLYWEGKTRCDFVKEVEFEETGDGYKTVQEDEGVYWSTIVTRTTHDSRIVKRFVWNITDHYSLYACTEPCDGGNSSGAYRLQGRTLSTTLATSDRRHCPINDRNVLHSLNMTWWTEQVKQNAYAFSIDRSLESCRTPRRNDNINRAMEFHTRLHQWCTSVIQYLNTIYVSTDDDIACKLRESALEHARTNPDEETLLALVPLFENSTVISGATVDHLLEADQSTIEKKIVDLTYLASRSSSSETNDTYGFSVQEATLEFLLRRMQRAIEQHSLNVDYVEDLLREQLIRAIGRELTSEDFDLFMASHYKAIFRPEFATRPFSHAVRRPNQYPVGIVSIEDEEQSDKAPVQTFSRRIKGESEPPILIPIDAATTIEMTGDRVLSGWIRYSFSSSDSVGSSTIVAHARQFSSYILLIGTMSSANTFEPKNAIVVQNKDVVKIPLLTEVLPSAKEFKNAIASLSPEQQEFARAMRSMQLHSSVFAMCIVQLKPQLERLLNLPENSLAKEIQLTEDLMSLFIEYQIPSDLFSYDGPTEGAVSEKVETVKTYVKQVMQVIQTTKEEKLAEEGMKRKMEDFLAPSSAPSGAPSAAPSGVPSGVPSSAPSGAPSELAREGGGYGKARNLRVASTGSGEVPGEYEDEEEDPAAQEQIPRDGSLEDAKAAGTDFTAIPARLDTVLEKQDAGSYLRSTILNTAHTWTRDRQSSLLARRHTRSFLSEFEHESEKRKALDLLDAISRSGTLPIFSSELHVVIGMTHCFERSLLDTVIIDNVNPIEKAEQSTLLVASTIYAVEPQHLLGDEETMNRLSSSFPSLFPQLASAQTNDGSSKS